MAGQNDADLNIGLNVPQTAVSNLQRQVDAIEKQLKPINLRFNASTNTFKDLSREVGNFNGYLERANQRVLGFSASVASLYGVVRFFKEIASSTIEVEKSLTDMNSIFKQSAAGVDRLSKSLFDIARSTSSSFADVTDTAKELARQGLGVEETLKRTKDAMVLARLGAIGYNEALSAITTGINSFSKEALDSSTILARLTSVDKSFAVSLGDLAGALTRVGSSASDVGVSFDQLVALVTSAKQITGRDGAVIAQALNTIFTRINKTDTLDLLESLGVAVHDARGEMLPTIQVLSNFAQTYDKLTGSIKTQAAEAVGGVRNLNTLKAVLSDLSKTQSIYSQVLNVSSQSTDEAIRRNDALNKSASALLQNFITTNKQILSNAGGLTFNSLFKTALSGTLDNPITKALEDATGSAETTGGKIAEGILRGIGNSLLIGAGPILAVAISKIMAQTLGGAAKSIIEEAGLNAESKQQAAIQSDIVALYARGGDALRVQLATMSSLVEKAALLDSLLSKQGIGRAAQVEEVTALASVIGRRRSGGAASGFVPLGVEASAISAGVGGAPSSAKAVYLPDFHTGGGNRGIVANTSEWIVPGAAGGAIFNRDMISRYGLPPGSKPVAAGGYIPHAAGGMDSYDYSSESAAYLHSMNGPVGPPYPNAQQWKKLGGNPMDAYAKDFAAAQSELAKLAKAEARLEAQKQAELEAIYTETVEKDGLLKKENLLSKTSLGVQEARLRQYRAGVDAEAQAWKEDANFRQAQKRSVAQSTIVGGPQSVLELRGIPGTNKGDNGRDLYRLSPAEEAANIVAANAVARGLPLPKGYGNETDLLQARQASGRDWPGTNLPNERFPWFDVSHRREGALAAPGIRERQAAARERAANPIVAGTSTYEEFGPYGPTRPTPRSWRDRIGLSTNKALMASFGLPFLGGAIEGLGGPGGTTRSMAIGGASSALNFAGLGAGIGSFGGPAGAGIGLGVGAIIGGVYGALSKITKSYEELADEVAQKNDRLGKQLSRASTAFGIQEQLNGGSLSPQRAQELRASLGENIAGIEDPVLQKLTLQGLTSPDARDRAISYGNQQTARGSTQTDLISGVSGVRSGTSLLNTISARGIFSGRVGFSDAADAKSSSALTSILLPIIAKLSPTQLKALQSLSRRAPAAAIQSLGRMAGLSPDQLDALAPGWSTNSASYAATISSAIDSAVSKNASYQTTAAGVTASTPPQYNLGQVTDIATKLRFQGQLGAITAGAAAQISGVGQRISLNNPLLTDVGRLGLQGQYGASNIGTQFGTQRADLLATGKGGLIDVLRTEGIRDKGINDRVSGISNLQGLLGLQNSLRTDSGSLPGVGREPFLKALADLIEKLQLLDATEKANLKVNTESNRLEMEDLQFRKTYAGAARDYQGLFKNAATEQETAYDRNDPPDIKAAKLRARVMAAAQRDVQSGKLTNQGYYGTLLGSSLNDDYNSRQSNGEATQLLVGNKSQYSRFLTGSQVSSGLFGLAKNAGTRGDALGSFTGGFQSVFSGIKRDLLDLSDTGQQVANILNSSLGNAFSSFVTGAQSGKDAARSFFASLFGQTSAMFGQRAISGLLSAIPGFGHAAGGPVGLASGGMVPTHVMGGEFYVSPQAASSIGYGRLASMNAGLRRAGGGMIAGGSGLRDDLSAMMPSGSFILKKAAVQQLGPQYLQSMVNGAVHRAGGGITPTAASLSFNSSVGPAPSMALNGESIGSGAGAAGGGFSLGGVGGQLAAGVILALIGRLLQGGGNHLLDAGGVTRNVNSMVASQSSMIAGRPAGSSSYLKPDGNGGYTLLSFGQEAATHNYSAAGGSVGAPLIMGTSGGGAGGGTAVHVTIHNHADGSSTSSSQTQGGGTGDKDFAERMGRAIKATVQEEMVNATRAGGLFQRNGRYSQSNYVS